MKQNQTVAWLWRVTGRKKGYIFALTIIQGVAGIIGVIYALLFRAIVDSAVGKDGASFRRYVLLIIGLVLVQLGISAVIRWLHELAKADIENTFKRRLLDNILRKEYASVSATHTAEWLNRLTSDTTLVAGGAVEILPGLFGTVVRLISALVMIIALDRWFAYILIPGGLLLMVLTYGFRGVLKKLHKNIQESDGRLRVFLQERISSLMVIKAFAAEKQTSAGAAEAMESHKKARLRRNRFSNVANIGFGAAMQGMYLIGVVYCAHGIMTGRVTYGTLTAVMQLIGQVQGPFANISGYLPRWYAMTASAERLMEVEGYDDDMQAADGETMRRYYTRDYRVLGLRNASFTYQPAGDEEMPVVLNGLNLEIRKGETVAFTGHSGCGKSTVLKLLMCMYPLSSGERYIDDQPLTAYYRRLFAYVPQGNALMNGTIRDVICFAQEYDESRLHRALVIACADEFVEDMNAELGERGTGLSEGQMQRLAIARAVYADAPVLLLDESTSALDEATERKLLENLRSMTEKTVVIVTHRKAALSICDRVLEFAESGVKEV
ncbi:MAG: ABC transporter ATP-binding protein [Clostridia bacterium]|nr:ABC transporter ATP-binding protein [Clostridia bacterium]